MRRREFLRSLGLAAVGVLTGAASALATGRHLEAVGVDHDGMCKPLRNLRETAGIQAAIAWVEQHPAATLGVSKEYALTRGGPPAGFVRALGTPYFVRKPCPTPPPRS